MNTRTTDGVIGSVILYTTILIVFLLRRFIRPYLQPVPYLVLTVLISIATAVLYTVATFIVESYRSHLLWDEKIPLPWCYLMDASATTLYFANGYAPRVYFGLFLARVPEKTAWRQLLLRLTWQAPILFTVVSVIVSHTWLEKGFDYCPLDGVSFEAGLFSACLVLLLDAYQYSWFKIFLDRLDTHYSETRTKQRKVALLRARTSFFIVFGGNLLALISTVADDFYLTLSSMNMVTSLVGLITPIIMAHIFGKQDASKVALQNSHDSVSTSKIMSSLNQSKTLVVPVKKSNLLDASQQHLSSNDNLRSIENLQVSNEDTLFKN